MQILAANQKPIIRTAQVAQQAQAPAADTGTEAPKDSFGKSVAREAFGEARDLSRRVSNMTSGAGAIIGATAGAYAGMVGGAAVGGTIGGRSAPPFSPISVTAVLIGIGLVVTKITLKNGVNSRWISRAFCTSPAK